MDNLLRLSIGVPAYNEELNIRSLLSTLLGQESDGFVLLEIIVVSDASTDETASQARSLGDPRVRVVENRSRIGQAVSQNEIIRQFSGDALLLLNADVSIHDKRFVAKMVAALKSRNRVGMASPAVLPLQAQNFFERVINFSVMLKHDVYERINGASNIYLCHGRARLMSREFAKQLAFPALPGEDAYSYIRCLELGYSFTYVKDAQVMYRSPQNLADHLKQSKRFFRGRVILSQSQGHALHYVIPWRVLLWSISLYFFRNPAYFLCYLYILTLSRIRAIYYSPTPIWDEALTSKRL